MENTKNTKHTKNSKNTNSKNTKNTKNINSENTKNTNPENPENVLLFKKIKHSPTKKLIYWTGYGAKNNGLHSPKEFLDIIQYQYPFWQIDCLTNKNKPKSHYCGKIMKENDIEEWMNFANAKWVSV
jgi:hypothetical protein